MGGQCFSLMKWNEIGLVPARSYWMHALASITIFYFPEERRLLLAVVYCYLMMFVVTLYVRSSFERSVINLVQLCTIVNTKLRHLF